MSIPVLYSAKAIEKQFITGEEPVMVLCSDMNTYICKYMRSFSTSYKLACELIGSMLAKSWRICTPDTAFVRIKPSHWNSVNVPHVVSAPAYGSKRMSDVIDITPSSFQSIPVNEASLLQLLSIALFDFWIANEDRNANNANLMFNVETNSLVSIDYGCILNTATFDFPLSQLTSTDTILWSDLFKHLSYGRDITYFEKILKGMKDYYRACIEASNNTTSLIIDLFPKEWHLPKEIISSKFEQLNNDDWIKSVWEDFTENLKDNIYNG